MKYIALLLIAVCAVSAQITRSNYHAGNCNTSSSSLYFVSSNNFQCLTGTVYPFNGETRAYTCSNGTIQYKNCTDTACANCNGPIVTVGTSVCIAWTTNDYSDQLSCGSSVPPTPFNTPLVSQFDGNGCTGSMQFLGAYGQDYCLASGLKYSCNATDLITYNCTAAGCGNCRVIETNQLSGGSFCSGFTEYQCLNATGALLPGTGSGSNSTVGGTSTTTAGRGTNINVTTPTPAPVPTSAPGGGDHSGAVTVAVSLALMAVAGLLLL